MITAPLHGYRDADDYYSQCSARQYLPNIQIPTLLIHAKDDPFMTNQSIPAPSELAPQVSLDLHDNGGHVGFVSGLPFKPQYLLEPRIMDFFRGFTQH
jgi:hypothetical protein